MMFPGPPFRRTTETEHGSGGRCLSSSTKTYSRWRGALEKLQVFWMGVAPPLHPPPIALNTKGFWKPIYSSLLPPALLPKDAKLQGICRDAGATNSPANPDSGAGWADAARLVHPVWVLRKPKTTFHPRFQGPLKAPTEDFSAPLLKAAADPPKPVWPADLNKSKLQDQ